jgi:hypothetical protein
MYILHDIGPFPDNVGVGLLGQSNSSKNWFASNADFGGQEHEHVFYPVVRALAQH